MENLTRLIKLELKEYLLNLGNPKHVNTITRGLGICSLLENYRQTIVILLCDNGQTFSDLVKNLDTSFYQTAEIEIESRREVKALCYDMENWPKFSRNFWYPVPHPSIQSAESAYCTKLRWANDEYGDNRQELCLWLADRLEQDTLI